jgi:TolA-binding protein
MLLARLIPFILFPLVVRAQAPPGPPAPQLQLTEEERKAEETFSLADGLFRKGFHDKALAQFLQFVQTYPQHANAALALFYAGECHYAENQFAEAAPLYVRVLTEYPQAGEVEVAAYRLAHCRFQLQDHEGAVAAFADLLKRAPQTQYKAAALYWAGESQYALGRHAEAVKSYEDSLREAPQGEFAAWAVYSIGMSQLELGNAEAALASFQRVARDYGDSPVAAECELRVADALRAGGKAAEAAKSYEAVLKRGDAKLAPGALHGLGWSHFDAEQYPQARQQFDRLLKEFAESPFAASARRGRANCLYHEKQYAEAARAYEEAQKGAPTEDVPELLFWQAASLEQSGDAARAKALFQRVAAEHPQHPLAAKAALRLAEASAEGEDLTAAEASYKAAAASTDPDLKARGELGLAWVAYKRGDTAEALKQYEALARANAASATGGTAALQGAQIALAAKDYARTAELAKLFLQGHAAEAEAPRARCLLGLALAATNKPDEAIRELEQSTQAAPKADFTVNALTTLSQLYRQAGNAAKADEALARLRRDFPDSAAGAEAQYDQATALFEGGKYAEARQAYEAVLKATEEPAIAAPAQYGIAACLLRENQLEAATAAYRKVVETYAGSDAAALAQYQLGVCLLQAGKAAEAAEALAGFVAEHPTHEKASEASAQLAWAYAGSGQPDKAKPIYEKLAGDAAAPAEVVADALLNLAEMAYAARDYEGALAGYDRVLAKQPAGALAAKALYKRGWALLQLKRTEEAVEAFRKCVAAGPDKPIAADCHLQIGAALLAQGDTDAALAELQGFTGEYRDEQTAPPALLMLADLYVQKGDWAKAEAAAKAVPDTGDEATVARRALLLGTALRHTDRAAEALPLLEAAAAKGSAGVAPRARFELAAALSASGKHAEAADAFLNVSILYGESPFAPQALYEAGHSFEAAGNKDEARKAYESLLRDYSQATEWVEKAEARLAALG